MVVVVGDVNSTVACSIVCAKLRSILCAHVEAGLRSYRPRICPRKSIESSPILIADLLLTPSPDGDENLLAERKVWQLTSHIQRVGNVMIDSLYSNLERSKEE